MAIISMFSVKGSPGVTTTAVALTRAWPSQGRSALCFEADCDGGDVAAGLLRGELDVPMGVMALAAIRSPDARQIWQCVVGIPPEEPVPGRTCGLLPGIPDSARGAALRPAWEALTAIGPSLDEMACDIFVDAGRVGASDLDRPWVASADLAILVMEPTLAQSVAASRVRGLWPAGHPPLLLLVIDRGLAAHSYRGAEVAAAVEAPLLGELCDDRLAAAVHSQGVGLGRRYLRSRYRRQVAALADALAARSPEAVLAAAGGR